MSNNNNSLIVIGIAAAVLLCGMAGAIIAISSDSNDTNDSSENTYATARAEAGVANGEVTQLMGEYKTFEKLPEQAVRLTLSPEAE